MADSPFSVSLDLALSGAGAPPRAAYDAALRASRDALEWLRAQKASGGLELLGIPTRTDDVKAAAKQAAALKVFSTVAVLGIGGSSLGGQALTALRKVQKPFVEFHDNPDPFAWERALKRFDLKKTHFIAISKSGGTAETLIQTLTAADALEKAGVRNLKKHFTVITEPHASPLADFADHLGAAKLDHPLGVGGRYSVLTMVGVLPALVMGLNVKQLRAGAAAALDQVLNAKTPADAPAVTVRPRNVNVSRSMASSSEAAFALASVSVRFHNKTANSSPPRRPTTSEERTWPTSVAAMAFKT